MKKEPWKIARIILQIIVFAGILFLFFRLGFSVPMIILYGVFMLLLLVFRTKLYKKIDKLMRKHIHFLARFPEWAIKLIIVAVFVLLYILIKEIIFEALKFFGVDIEGMITDSINRSVKK